MREGPPEHSAIHSGSFQRPRGLHDSSLMEASECPEGVGGLGERRKRCGVRGTRPVGQRWWSIEFDQSISDWLGRCLYPHSRAAAGGGGGSRDACGVCGLVRGVLWPFVSGVSRGLAANAHSSLPLLWHRHARRCPSPGEGWRTAAAVCTSAFWTFWSSCAAVMHGPQCDRGSAWGWVGWWRRGEECEGLRGAHWRRRLRER